MKNKGFTIIELLASITIIAILGALAAISYTGIINSSKQKSYLSYETTMQDSATKYVEKFSVVPNVLDFRYFKLSELISKKYLEPIKDPFANNSTTTCIPDSYVLLIRCENKDLSFQSAGYNLLYINCLKCSSGYKTSFNYRGVPLNVGNNNTGDNICTLKEENINKNTVQTLCQHKLLIEG